MGPVTHIVGKMVITTYHSTIYYLFVSALQSLTEQLSSNMYTALLQFCWLF